MFEMPDTATILESALWDYLKHPRGRGGEFAAVGGELGRKGQSVGESEGPALSRPKIARKDKPIEATNAFRRGRRRPEFMTEHGLHGDEWMAEIGTDRGFAGAPHKVSEAELAQHIADGDKELWRGVTDESYADALTSGPIYYGQGFRGNGIYAASGEKARTMAESYAQAPPSRGTIVTKVDKPVVIHMALAREARTVSYEEAFAKARDEQLHWAGMKGGAEAESGAVMAQALNSPSRWALANGYDAVVVPQADGSDEVIVLNRTALLVSTEFAGAGQNVTRRIREAEAA